MSGVYLTYTPFTPLGINISIVLVIRNHLVCRSVMCKYHKISANATILYNDLSVIRNPGCDPLFLGLRSPFEKSVTSLMMFTGSCTGE